MASLYPWSWCRVCVLMAVAVGLGVPGVVWGQAAADADAMFRRLDVNKDGKLTMGDASGNSRRMLENIFEMAGKPTTGTVTRDEFQQVFERHQSGRGGNRPAERNGIRDPESRPEPGARAGLPPVLRDLDRDGDQRISRGELSRLSQVFDQLDTNEDGQLDADEINAGLRGVPESSPRGTETRRPNSSLQERTAERAESHGRPANAAAGSSKPLQGVWRGRIVEPPGGGGGHAMDIELTITADRITGKEIGNRRGGGGGGRGPGLGTGSYELTGDGKSGNLDADGLEGQQDGRHFQGIFELDGDTLRWCVSNRGRQRPKEMASGQGNYLMVLSRQGGR